ncbi:MAG TPA: cysteine--tRNA ligase [Firmicutes bacterium]|nr:cysteine--tRNA ligase [Bacillota bacterium]
MQLYNTLSHKVEEFIPHTPEVVKMYTCGPTVYHFAHIGNLRTYISEDVLEKALKYCGYYVQRAMNITDVGHLTSDSDSGTDKMVDSAKKEHKSVLEIAEFYTDAFFKDCEKLNIRRPDIVSKATDNVDFYLEIIADLLKKGYAYEANGNIYFDITKLDDYYKLTNHKADDMVVGVREGVEEDLGKKNQGDFVLWFTKSKFQDQELKWPSPYGEGYPGWHIECTGISIKNLGEYLDIHCGGVDNIFPHHTNEIAQSESYLGHKWCNYWFHGEHLNVKDSKMSKSKGNIITVSTLEEEGYNPLSYRYMCLNSHYRKILEFTFDTLKSNESGYLKLLNRISMIKNEGDFQDAAYKDYNERFMDALKDDLNTANAMTVLYDVLKDEGLNGHTKLDLIRSFDKVLSLNLISELHEKTHPQHEEIMALIEKRAEFKKNHQFTEADGIRDELAEKGIELVDTREGTIYKMKE